jgi:AraC-like DNA-binding protein
VRPDTVSSRQRLYLLTRVIVTRHYRRELTLAVVARALSSSPRQIQRAYQQFGNTSFSEDLRARRLAVGAQLLIEQRSLAVDDVARLVGYSDAQHFALAFRRRYGLTPARFRGAARQAEGSSYTAAGSSSRSPASRPSASNSVTVSVPGSRSRISVPPPGAGSAATLPPC